MTSFKGQLFSFLGRSGSGKGTQFDFFEEKLKEEGYDILRHMSGDFFRSISKKSSPSARKIKKILDEGGLMPAWIASYTWEKNLIERLESRDTVVLFDGSPRRLKEAKHLDRVVEWLELSPLVPVHVDVPPKEIRERLLLRGRSDDTEDAIDARLAWFEEEVAPILDYYEQQGRLITVNGVGEPKEIFERILTALTAIL